MSERGRGARWLPLTLLLAAATGLAKAPAPAAATRADATLDLASIVKPWTGDLDQMVERRRIRVLVVPSMTFFFNDKGQQRGVTYDTFQLVEKELNKKIRRARKGKRAPAPVKFFYIPVAREKIFSALNEGRGDVAAANLSITDKRREVVDFSAPIMTDVQEVVLTGPVSPVLSTLDDLSGQEVFVRKSSSYHESLLALNERLAAANKPPVKLKEAPDALEDEDLIEMLNAGLVSVVVVDKHIADFWKKVFPKIRVHEAITVGTEGDIGWAIRKDSPQLKTFLDGVAAEITSGHLRDEREWILTKYLRRLGHVTAAGTEAERKKFLALIEIFRKYGDRYDVDWLLMAAQGYQESRLDQAARSRAGAIGVMQVLPATGEELGVGDITKTDPNIHAGVKYLRFMIDQYFEKEPMTKTDRVLFAFASYNAGPARIARLRKEAARRGLDPNVWFHNVEVVVEEKVGHETVTYVGNIFKYYVAYRLIEDTLEERERARQNANG
jgi:membrane-bound lytic murein transglycosylase MltF